MVEEKFMENIGKHNYHSHTYRCGHAAKVPDKDYIEKAIKDDFTQYGISDHIPVHPIFYGDSIMRMHDNDVDDYLESIAKLKRIYSSDIKVYSAFEAEYDEIIEAYLCQLRNRCDYMLLGQHYILNKNIRRSGDYPIEYAKKVCTAIESGIFDIVAHPDIFMKYFYDITDERTKKLFLKNALLAAKMICEKALGYGIPLEINLGDVGDLDKNIIIKDLIRYPNDLFWDVAKEMGNAVVVGIDAHSPMQIDLRELYLERIGRRINLQKLAFVTDDFCPVSNRKNNMKLSSAYDKTEEQLTSVESRLVASYIDDYLLEENDGDLKSYMARRITPPANKYSSSIPLPKLTENYQKELLNVVNQSIDENAKSKENIKEVIVSDIDNYYGAKQKKLKKIK